MGTTQVWRKCGGMYESSPRKKEGKLGAYAIKRVAAGAHLPTPWLFEPAKRPDDRANYCLDWRGVCENNIHALNHKESKMKIVK